MIENVPINYVELKAPDIEAVKDFYQQAFAWTFTDYGPTYTAFSNSGVEGGFEKTDQEVANGALIVLHHENLELIQEQVEKAGGKISVPIFSFLAEEDFSL